MTDLKNQIEKRAQDIRDDARMHGVDKSLSKIRFYILDDDGDVRKVDWAEWGARHELVGVNDIIMSDQVMKQVKVSTVFLGFDCNYMPGGPPLFFETMVFGGLLDQERRRYILIQDAREGHVETVEKVKRAEKRSAP